MKITMLHGSGRKNGNTAIVLGWVEEELKNNGHSVETVFLATKDLKGCLGCALCKEKPDTIGCVQKDDVIEVLEKIIESDLTVFASPLYFWGVTSQLKTIIDRTYSLYTRYHMEGHASLIEGKRQALVLTGGGGFDNNAEGTYDAFRRMQNPHKTINAGELFIGGCKVPEDIDESVKKKAVEFAQKIVS